MSVQLGSRGVKWFPGQKKGYAGSAASYGGGGFAMHLLAFIFVLGLLFVFLMPFFTVAAACSARWRRRAEFIVRDFWIYFEGCIVVVALVSAIDSGLGRERG